jgi:hypothetical protein
MAPPYVADRGAGCLGDFLFQADQQFSSRDSFERSGAFATASFRFFYVKRRECLSVDESHIVLASIIGSQRVEGVPPAAAVLNGPPRFKRQRVA